jgi:hypothetical protein
MHQSRGGIGSTKHGKSGLPAFASKQVKTCLVAITIGANCPAYADDAETFKDSIIATGATWVGDRR